MAFSKDKMSAAIKVIIHDKTNGEQLRRILFEAPAYAMEIIAVYFYEVYYKSVLTEEDRVEIKNLRDEIDATLEREDLEYLVKVMPEPDKTRYMEMLKRILQKPSDPTASPVTARTKNEGSTSMKRNTTVTTQQHLGKGSGVDWSRENKVFAEMLAKHGIREFHVEMANPYLAEISIPMIVNKNVVRRFTNDLFHELDVLDADYNLDFGQLTDCSGLDLNETTRCYYVVFNHHDVKESRPGDAMYKYKVEVYEADGGDGEDADLDGAGDGALTPAQIMKYVADGIKSGAFRSKSGEGYFVLKGECYDAIEMGRKTTEYRDLTPRNLSLSIGIKTVKFQRGYGHPGKPPRQMRFEVKSVRLLDASDRECDPYAIPPGFIATTIAIHLGKRIG